MKTLDRRIHSAFEWLLERFPGPLGDPLRQATGGRFGIGSQIVVGLGVGVTMTIGAVVLALLLMSIVSSRQSEVTEGHMPALVAAFEVARSSSELVRASPRLLAADDPADLKEVGRDVVREEETLRRWLVEVMRAESKGGVEGGVGSAVVPLADSLVESINQIQESVARRMEYRSRLRELEGQVESLGLELQLLLEELVDDQHFFMHTGHRGLDDVPVPAGRRTSRSELAHYTGLLDFQASQNLTTTFIQQAMTENDPELLRANRERVETAMSDVRRALAGIRPEIRARLQPRVATLNDFYAAPDGAFETRTRELMEVRRSEDLLARNQQTTADLVAMVEGLVKDAEVSTHNAANRSRNLVRIGFWFLLGVTLVTLVGAYFAWRFFGERLLVRMAGLFDATRRMSKGDLEVEVRIDGNDEVTDMAEALEVFRKHAVEVQRLNLVEKLAAEVQTKNAELETTLEDLKRTQQQVISQEKLASLGALTAGIAHEIRNPLNFVNNFAGLSSELIDELREELKGEGDGEGGMDEELVEEILGDLSGNVVKVKEHGERANRIVEGMLAHSRNEAGQVESVDVNLLLDEYAKLAYHGLRGTDSTFNINLVKEFDDAAGEVEAVSRDLSRVFLNVVTNACHATIARGKEAEGSYEPTVWLRTEGSETSVSVSIRDNGTGIPDHIVDKIFDPFFTTKSGTQGTGLGLSISHEIVREHGGEFQVETEVGEYTEFRIVLARKGFSSGAPAT